MWKTVKLGDVCDLQNGFAFKSSLFREKGLPILRISNIQNEEVSLEKLTYFVEKDYGISFERYKVLPNDLLIAMSGATTGKLGFNQSGRTLYLNQRVGKFEPKSGLDKKYLYYVLSTKVEENLSISKGAAQPNLSAQQIKDIKFPLPPLAEQQRIVAKLDAAFAEIDRAVEFATSCLENTKAIINSTLNEFFIAEGKQWNVVPLADTCIIERGSSPRPIKQFLTEDEGGNWIKIGDTDKDGKYVRGTKEKITFEGAKKSRSVRKGDFILTNSMSYGRPYIMDIDGCIHDGWFALRLNENIDSEYYYYLLA